MGAIEARFAAINEKFVALLSCLSLSGNPAVGAAVGTPPTIANVFCTSVIGTGSMLVGLGTDVCVLSRSYYRLR